MLKKLIHYDLKSISKIWLIGLLATLALSFVAGVCGYFLYSDKEYTEVINVLSVFVLIISFLAVGIFAVGTSLIVYIRFYKHFYTDEGYLTFTLPVKRSQLLNSKIISGAIIEGATIFMIFLEIIIAIATATREDFFSAEAYDFFKEAIAELQADNDLLFGVIIIFAEVLISSVLLSLTSLLFTYLCISIGCSVTRKNKVLTAVGIYYGATGVLTFILQIISLFGISGISALVDKIPDDMSDGVILLGFAVPILFLSMIVTILYGLNYWILDKKLNLT